MVPCRPSSTIRFFKSSSQRFIGLPTRDGRIYVKLAPFGRGENANEMDDVKSRVDVKSSIFAPELVIQIVNHSCLMT